MQIEQSLKCPVRIKIDSLNKESAYKERIQQTYLPRYLRRMKCNNKKVSEPSQDRLAELTTQQIDRIIYIQKTRQHLLQKKHKAITIQIDKKKLEKMHMNVYSSSFISKINRIAVKKNIRHLRSQQFDENQEQTKFLKRAQQLSHSRQDTLQYQKVYSCDVRRICTEKEQTKSISSIQDNVQEFQRQLSFKKRQAQHRKGSKPVDSNKSVFVENRWFTGMSRIYLDHKFKDEIATADSMNQKSLRSFDIEYTKHQSNKKDPTYYSSKWRNTMLTTNYS